MRYAVPPAMPLVFEAAKKAAVHTTALVLASLP